MNFAEFVQNYAPTILYAALTAIAGFLGACVKRIYSRISDDQTKKEVAETVVRAVEQMYESEAGSVKKTKAADAILRLLTEKKIPITAAELDTLIEAAVAQFKRLCGNK